ERARRPDQSDPRGEERDPRSERARGEVGDAVDRRQELDERADEDGVRDSAESRCAPERPREEKNRQPDGDVRRAERERRVACEPLVQHVPGREPEPRLEYEHDREREQEEPGDEAGETGGQPAPDAGMRALHDAERTAGLVTAAAATTA